MSRGRWETLCAIDFDAKAAATYAANFPGVDVRCARVGDELGRLPDADVILAGPPCQDFSTAGKGAGEKGSRDGWPDFIAAIRKVKPRMFLAENVPGMLNAKHANYRGRIIRDLEAAGYAVDIRLLDAVNFGAPQFRERLWFWGIRSDVYAAGVRHAWPKPTHAWPWPTDDCMFGGNLLPAVTVGQALGIDGAIRRNRGNMAERGGDVVRRHHPTTEPCPTINDASGGGDGPLRVIEYRWSPEMLAKHPPASPASPAPTVQAKYFKGGAEGLVEVTRDPKHPVQRSEQPAVTLTSGGDGHGPTENSLKLSVDGRTWENRHPIPGPDEPMPTLRARSPRDGGRCTENVIREKHYVRRLSPLECARLQSCPDDFAWPEKITKTAQYRIIGNGWNCAIAAALSRALGEADPQSRTVIDLFCGGGLGAMGWHQRWWRYEP